MLYGMTTEIEKQIEYRTVVRVDTVYQRDTIHLTPSPTVFKNFNEVVFFTEYCKTESSQLNDDNWAVLKTMLNRIRRSGKNWYGFSHTWEDHYSPTITEMYATGKRYQPFSMNSTHDLRLIIRTLCASQGMFPAHIDSLITPNVYYFESHDLEWNKNKDRGIFKRKNIKAEFLHEFYSDGT